MKPAHNAKVLTTGIAIASTLGISTAYTIKANAQILEKIEAAQTAVTVDPALAANTPVVAPTTPGPATTASKISGVSPVKKNKNATSVVTPETPATTPIASNPPDTIAPAPPTTAPPTSSSK